MADLEKAEELGAPAAMPLELADLDEMVIERAAMIYGGNRPEGLAEGTIRTQLLEHAEGLVADAPNAAEWQLALSAAYVWLELRVTEREAWRRPTTNGTSPALLDLVERRVGRLRRRYTSMLRTLAELRRLAAPLLMRLRTESFDLDVAERHQARRPAPVPREQS